jgi:hypothetical protein
MSVGFRAASHRARDQNSGGAKGLSQRLGRNFPLSGDTQVRPSLGLIEPGVVLEPGLRYYPSTTRGTRGRDASRRPIFVLRPGPVVGARGA